MRLTRTTRCPDCGGEGVVPVRACGHLGCCPCVEGEAICETCAGDGSVPVECAECGEPLLLDDDEMCGECREAMDETAAEERQGAVQ